MAYNYKGQKDEPMLDGDAMFVGVDSRHDPGIVKPGYVSFARNARFTKGRLDSRKGVHAQLYSVLPSVDFPIDFPFDFTGQTGIGKVYGSGVFADPNGLEWIMVAVANHVYVVRDGYPLQKLSLPSGTTIKEDVFFVQAFDRVIMFRGQSLAPLVWNPAQNGLPPYDNDWESIAQTPFTEGDGTEQIPNASSGALIQNRLLVPYGRDKIAISDVLDYTRYEPQLQDFRINEGSDDNLVLAFPFAESNVIAFKSRSISLVQNVYGDLSQIRQTTATREHGLVARLSVVNVGNDVWFLSDNGIYSIKQVLDNKLQGTTEPLSAPIQPLIERINWRAAGKAAGAYYDNKYFLAVPIDNSLENNIILVYDFLNEAWSGYDDGDMLNVQSFFKAIYRGKQSLYFVNTSGYICVYSVGLEDQAGKTFYPITFEMITRGYNFGTLYHKKFDEGQIELETWNPKYSLEVLQTGTSETFPVVTDRERSRRKYQSFGKAKYQLNNNNDDAMARLREDYSVQLNSEPLVTPDWYSAGRQSFIGDFAGYTGIVASVALASPGKPIVAGAMTAWKGTPVEGLGYHDGAGARTLSGPVFSEWGYLSTERVNVVRGSGNAFYAGGGFGKCNTLDYPNIVRVNTAGVLDDTFNAGLGARIEDIEYLGNTLSASFVQPALGSTVTISVNSTFGAVVGNGAIINENRYIITAIGDHALTIQSCGDELVDGVIAGATVTTPKSIGFITYGRGEIFDVLPTAGGVYVVGNFQMFGEVRCSHIARLFSNGTVDTSFNPNWRCNDGYLSKIASYSSNKLIFAGSFGHLAYNVYNNIDHAYASACDTSGALVAAFQPVVTHPIGAILVSADTVYLAEGSLRGGCGTLTPTLYKVYLSDGSDASFSPQGTFNASGEEGLTSLVEVSGKIYVGGYLDGFTKPDMSNVDSGPGIIAISTFTGYPVELEINQVLVGGKPSLYAGAVLDMVLNNDEITFVGEFEGYDFAFSDINLLRMDLAGAIV